ncbi:serine/threonine protein kinase [Cohnella endophytica]|uniref:Serine/threonine protein kinase n=1 Tax=Cohnella endophytica TaxID=2419778 RepID=A0A494X4Z0_9BACL|nr:protein kinase [Cohnella endophytica]RKP45412.1 serine/threonine protein kinase [Cohnella endophytica]
MTTSSNEQRPLPKGTEIRGRWNGKQYRLERLLGLGSNGHVYLASSGIGYRSACAVKLGFETSELQGEANILASLDSSEKGRVPFLLDVDDAVIDGKNIPYYVMRYIPGSPIQAYLRQHGPQWLGVVGFRLLERLAQLHEAGWAFGDIKSDNVLVGEYGRVELVDYGGASAIGRSVRQFTEIYDRGYWFAGSRIADPAYDHFSVAMLWLHALEGKRLVQLTRTLLPQNRHPRELMKLVRSNARLAPLESWMEKALNGKFENTKEASEEWRSVFRSSQRLKAPEDRVPRWMAGLLGGAILLSVSATAVWLLQ